MTRQQHDDGPVDDESVVRDELLACLQSIAHLHEHDASADTLVAGLPLEEGCLTPSVFPRAADNAGMAANLVKAPLETLNSALLPAVLLLEPGRACVLVHLDLARGAARVIYPEIGDAEATVALDSLQSRYSGRAIYVRPRFRFDDRTEGRRSRRDHHWFWGVIRENRRLYRDVVLGSLAINLFAVAMPLFVLNIYDRVVPNQATETMWVLATGIFIVLCFDLVLRLLRSAFIDLAASRADVKLSSSIIEQVLGLRMSSRPASTGSFAATLQSYESIRAFIGSATVVGLVDLPFVLLFAGIIALIAPPLVIPVLVGIVFVLLYALAAQSKLHELSETTWRISAQRNASLVEMVSQLETVKAMRREGRLQSSWEKASAFLSRTSARLRLISSSVSSVALWAQNSVAVCVILVGVYQIMAGNLTQGGLIAAYLLSSRAMAPVSQAASLLAQYHHASTALESLEDVMQRPVERSAERSYIDRPVMEGDIQFDHVTFRYPDEERDALRDIALSFRAGEKVALLGKVGCGKSTLAKLILGLYEPSAGDVRVDGVDIRQLDPSQLRRHIGYVPQDISLFYGTLRENILVGAGSDAVDEAALLRAVKLSGLDSLVNGHPRGLELEVGERGQRLSGGQRQAVAVARALVHDPRILLFDEPSSSMDHSSERALRERLDEYDHDKTLLLVTHRTSLLPLVDRVVVMDAGHVVADGPRDKVVDALRKGQIGVGA
ncbi:type I secretion system permease/ATPase [Halomonas sabkhae]|uniref:type I secretion system permease/ATPase n=1 Tax=Halomonas sabkhae TaxID=626223 RepID=UPI0025B30920|nr:type I secretion system permease/ATPase [Halomonas sabkhae]MDN3526325.1 type I secretion system permease/ATPase [Halomonas sabkhae]